MFEDNDQIDINMTDIVPEKPKVSTRPDKFIFTFKLPSEQLLELFFLSEKCLSDAIVI